MGSVAYYTYDVMDRVTGVTDYLGRGTEFTYDREGNLTSVTDAAGRKEVCTTISQDGSHPIPPTEETGSAMIMTSWMIW